GFGRPVGARPGLGALAALAARLAGLLGRKLMGGPLGVRRHAALAARDARLLRGEVMGRALGVRGLPTLAGDLPLLLWVHASESTLARLGHGGDPLCETRAVFPSGCYDRANRSSGENRVGRDYSSARGTGPAVPVGMLLAAVASQQPPSSV